MNRKERVSIRITSNQELVLQELSESLNVSISMLIRTIIGSWLSQNEDAIYRLIDKKKLEKDPNYKVPKEEDNNIFEY